MKTILHLNNSFSLAKRKRDPAPQQDYPSSFLILIGFFLVVGLVLNLTSQGALK